MLRLKGLGRRTIFSQDLALATGVTAAQVRKDFSVFNIPGNRRGGYSIEALLDRIADILGLNEVNPFILVGVGNLGRALLGYPGFQGQGIRIIAGFDIDPAKFTLELEVPVLPLSELAGFVKARAVEFGIITVPDLAAQQVLELMAGAGIKGILNFAPIWLNPPAGCFVHNVNLATELASLIYMVKASRSRAG